MLNNSSNLKLSKILDSFNLKLVSPLLCDTSTMSTILVKDEDGIVYSTIISNLFNGKKPSIQTAIDKTNAFIVQARKTHKENYFYDKVKYMTSQKQIVITCPKHGDFNQIPNNHLRGKGCNICARKSTKEFFIERSSVIHNNKYNYSLVNYLNSQTKVKIICNLHGVFEQKPNTHIRGANCPTCMKENAGVYSKTGWTSICKRVNNKKPSLYIIKCFNDHEEFIKIGITSKSIKSRFLYKAKFPYNYTLLTEIKSSPVKIWDLEKKLHKIYSSFRYKPSVYFSGETECFSSNIYI